MITRYEDCAGHAYDMMKVEEKRGGLVNEGAGSKNDSG